VNTVLISYYVCVSVGQDSIVGIATCNRLDGLETESQ
jgi:hypothetical protein